MQQKIIAFLDEGTGIGGAQTNLIALLRHLDKNKFQPLLIAASKGKFYNLVRGSGTETAVIKAPPFFSTSLEFGTVRVPNIFAVVYNLVNIFFRSLRLRSYLLRHKVDILQTAGMFSHIYGGFAARASRTACLWHMQDVPAKGFLLGLGRVFLNILAFILPQKIIVISQTVKDTFSKAIQDKIFIIYNGVDTKRFSPQASAFREKIRKNLGVEESETVVGMTSRLTPWKGHRLFLESARLVAQNHPEAKFLIVGDAIFGRKSYVAELKDLAHRLGIEERVVFAGFVDVIEEVLGIIDIFTHCSLRPEGFGLDIIEAMSMEKAVVATNMGAPKEIIDDGINGVLVEPGNPLSLSEKIRHLLAHEEERISLGLAGRKKVEACFSLERYCREMEKFYYFLLNTKQIS